jgi:DNA-binding transcriptional ArsR family regulator
LDSFERLLWWVFAGSAGGVNRALVLRAIRDKPSNALALSERIGMDYSSVRHHLRVLEQNRLVVTEGEKYGKLYFISDAMESNWSKLESVLERNSRNK